MHRSLCLPAQNDLSDYDTIRCINYIRAQVAAGRFSLETLTGQASTQRPWQEDKYMHPFIPGDPLLFYDFDDNSAPDLDKYDAQCAQVMY